MIYVFFFTNTSVCFAKYSDLSTSWASYRDSHSHCLPFKRRTHSNPYYGNSSKSERKYDRELDIMDILE